MNIIELFENLNINKEKTLHFTPDEIIRIEKQINVEKKLNPDVDVNVASNLVDALRNYPEEFQFIANDRILYNFFSKKSYYRDHFPKENIEIDNEKVKSFIGKFLEEDLALFFDRKLTENKFEEMHDLLRYKDFFLEDILYKVAKKGEGKLDLALSNLHSENVNYSKILYIKEVYFYVFLSHFSTLELDDKVKSLLNVVVDIYNVDKRSDFAGTTMISMSNYTAFDDDLAETLEGNKKVVQSNINGRTETSSGSSSGFSWKTFLIVIFILLKVALIGNRCSSNDSSSNYDYNQNNDTYDNVTSASEKRTIDEYYTEWHSKIDTFKTFLTHYDRDIIANVSYNDSIKSGENPFESFYECKNVSQSNNFLKFTNTTNYDVIVLENSVAYDTIKVPRQAYFIKAKQSADVDIMNNNGAIFNFYVGKKLGSFHNQNEKLYVRNHSVVEPRFSELIKNAREIIDVDYTFGNDDVTLSIENGQFVANSGTSVKAESFKELAKDEEKVIEELSKSN